MEKLRTSSLLIIVMVFVSAAIEVKAASVKCEVPGTRCYGYTIDCPYECPYTYSRNPRAKVCQVDCNHPHCKSQCKKPKADCDSPGSACYDPRFIGGDGIVFYFHGKSNENFNLVSDRSFQINGRFIGHRPEGRSRDFTWIQALGILFNGQKFSLDAKRVATWDSEVDHLSFSYNGEEFSIPEERLSVWYSPDKDIKVERVSIQNSVIVSLKDSAEILVNVVPVTKQDDKIHSYKVPSDDCFAHLEVQFRFSNLSKKVNGVLGRTYRPDFENPAKPGVAMAVLGDEDKYRISSLFSTECQTCVFSGENGFDEEGSGILEPGSLDCTRRSSAGYGIVCKK